MVSRSEATSTFQRILASASAGAANAANAAAAAPTTPVEKAAGPNYRMIFFVVLALAVLGVGAWWYFRGRKRAAGSSSGSGSSRGTSSGGAVAGGKTDYVLTPKMKGSGPTLPVKGGRIAPTGGKDA